MTCVGFAAWAAAKTLREGLPVDLSLEDGLFFCMAAQFSRAFFKTAPCFRMALHFSSGKTNCRQFNCVQ